MVERVLNIKSISNAILSHIWGSYKVRWTFNTEEKIFDRIATEIGTSSKVVFLESLRSGVSLWTLDLASALRLDHQRFSRTRKFTDLLFRIRQNYYKRKIQLSGRNVGKRITLTVRQMVSARRIKFDLFFLRRIRTRFPRRRIVRRANIRYICRSNWKENEKGLLYHSSKVGYTIVWTIRAIIAYLFR